MTLLLKRIIRRGSAFYCYSLRLNLKWLFCLWCCNQCTCYNNSCSYIEFGNLLKVLHIIMIYDLKWCKKCSIIDDNKAKCFGVSDTSYPSPNGNFFIQVCFLVLV